MSVARPRGPLPARVYWRRRLVLLGVAFALVFGIGRVLDGAGGSASGPSARPASAVGSGSASPSTSALPSALPMTDVASAGPGATGPRVRVPLATPTGPCQDSDVRVVPAMEDEVYAGGDVALTLALTTFESPACTWEVAAESVAVKLTSGSDRIWSSQDCPGAVPEEPVVLRSAQETLVDVVWTGRRSDPDCSRTTLWAEPGYYHLSAAAMGSEPESQQFRLMPPAPVTITPTPTPSKDEPRGGEGSQSDRKPQAEESSRPERSGND